MIMGNNLPNQVQQFQNVETLVEGNTSNIINSQYKMGHTHKGKLGATTNSNFLKNNPGGPGYKMSILRSVQ